MDNYFTRRANFYNMLALGTVRTGIGITAMFTVLSGVTGQVMPAIIFGASLIPQAGLAWLDGRHLKAHDNPARQPAPETTERARHRCKQAFLRVIAPVVIFAAAYGLAFAANPNPAPVKFPTPELKG